MSGRQRGDGVLRAIGFRRAMIEAALLLESSFVALTAIVVGSGLGLLLALKIIRDSQSQPSGDNLTLVVPWGSLAIIFVTVYAVALLAHVGAGRSRLAHQAGRGTALPIAA